MVTHKGDCSVITGVDFSPEQVLDCGQAFRWSPYKNGYRGVAFGRALYCLSEGGALVLYPCNQADWQSAWKNYFDFDRDYDKCRSVLCRDENVKRGIEFARGLRLLNQQPFETLISFIISANNNVKRIRGIIERICERCGAEFTQEAFPGDVFYAFPTPAELSALGESELASLGAGYRSSYIAETSRVIASGYDLSAIGDLPYTEAKKALCGLKGVGPKVADCILLFAYGFGEAFPLDVWVKRVMSELYGIENPTDVKIRTLVDERFGSLAGLAQQYLFYYAKSIGFGK